MNHQMISKWLVLSTVAIGFAKADISLVGSLDPNDPQSVFLYQFAATNGTTLTVQSLGFGGSGATFNGKNAAGQVIAPGGFDTYLSLFLGVGPSGTFLASNDDGFCPPGATDSGVCADSTLQAQLAAGNYTLALSTFGNMSFAENLGDGNLGDGFIGLGSYYNAGTFSDRSAAFALDLNARGGSITPLATPEPGAWTMLALGIGGLGVARIRRRRRSF